jgi:hypothetical protein
MLENLHPDILNISEIADFAEIQNYLIENNFKIEINKNIQKLKSIIEEIPKVDYPFQYDRAFKLENIKTNYFSILLYHDEKVIGTYAAISMPVKHCLLDDVFVNNKNVNNNPLFVEGINDDLSWYSSLQWIHKEYRGRKLGIFLDYLKKNIIFSLLGGEINYAIFNKNLIDYHLIQLNYKGEEWLATVNNDSLGLLGDNSEKIYHVCYIDKPSWYQIKDEIFYKNL